MRITMFKTKSRTAMGVSVLALVATSALGGAQAASASSDQQRSTAGQQGTAQAGSVESSEVVGADKWGKWVQWQPHVSKCRVYIAIAASAETVNGMAEGHCKSKLHQTIMGKVFQASDPGNDGDIKKLGSGRVVTGNTVKLKNKKGKQKWCVIGTSKSPIVEPGPGKVSEAKVCVTA